MHLSAIPWEDQNYPLERRCPSRKQLSNGSSFVLLMTLFYSAMRSLYHLLCQLCLQSPQAKGPTKRIDSPFLFLYPGSSPRPDMIVASPPPALTSYSPHAHRDFSFSKPFGPLHVLYWNVSDRRIFLSYGSFMKMNVANFSLQREIFFVPFFQRPRPPETNFPPSNPRMPGLSSTLFSPCFVVSSRSLVFSIPPSFAFPFWPFSCALGSSPRMLSWLPPLQLRFSARIIFSPPTSLSSHPSPTKPGLAEKAFARHLCGCLSLDSLFPFREHFAGSPCIAMPSIIKCLAPLS